MLNFPPSLIAPFFAWRRGQTTVTVVGQQLVPGNSNRVLLVIFGQGGAGYWVRPDNLVQTMTGFAVTPNVEREFWFRRYGAMVGYEWFVSDATVPITVDWGELVFVPQTE